MHRVTIRREVGGAAGVQPVRRAPQCIRNSEERADSLCMTGGGASERMGYEGWGGVLGAVSRISRPQYMATDCLFSQAALTLAYVLVFVGGGAERYEPCGAGRESNQLKLLRPAPPLQDQNMCSVTSHHVRVIHLTSIRTILENVTCRHVRTRPIRASRDTAVKMTLVHHNVVM